jgi:aryl-phospho-beta-D-glucosidase BglC (GH1 family)
MEYAVSGRGGSLLPSGYLSTSGNQVVDADGHPVRIASIGWSGSDSLTFAPEGLFQLSISNTIGSIKAAGFNTIRLPWSDLFLTASPRDDAAYTAINYDLNPELKGLSSLEVFDQIIAAAGEAGLKVILDHHTNDGGPGGWGGAQANGLWFDRGEGSDGTDGSGTPGTVTAEKFLENWVALAERYANDHTVIGFDLHNEPNNSTGRLNWGGGGPTDIHAMYERVGNAIQAVNPHALIIVEGPQMWSGAAPGLPAGAPAGDLSGVATLPVELGIPNKVVYSVHAYPPGISMNGSYDPAQMVADWTAGWGYLVAHNTAPVWIGEMGTSMDAARDRLWATTLIDYMNGKLDAQGGPSFSSDVQPMSGSWWKWGSTPQHVLLNGILTDWSSGRLQADQASVIDQMLFRPSGIAPTGHDVVGGEGKDLLLGTTSRDCFEGAGGDDIIIAYAGDDVVTGGWGDDAITTGTGADRIAYEPGDGRDWIEDFSPGQDSIELHGIRPDEVMMHRNTYGASSGLEVGLPDDGMLFLVGVSALKFGDLTFAREAPGHTVGVELGGGPDRLLLHISQDAFKGDAQYLVRVDGQEIGGVRTASASHAAGSSERVALNGDWSAGEHLVEIVFLNDLWGGASSGDRNLYLDHASYNGVLVENSKQFSYDGTAMRVFFADTSGPARRIDKAIDGSGNDGLPAGAGANIPTHTGRGDGSAASDLAISCSEVRLDDAGQPLHADSGIWW